MTVLLEGVRVVDLTDAYGALTARVLGDLGAEVVRIEVPGGGEGVRRAPRAEDGDERQARAVEAGRHGIVALAELERPEGAAVGAAAPAREAQRGQNLPADMDAALDARVTYQPENWTHPYGVHVAAVEVSRELGTVDLLGYWIAHDCGTLLNPLLVDGQLAGGVAQGIGGALLERLVYDEAGQPLCRSFMEYALPTAAAVPPLAIAHLATPSPHTPGGMKGMAEGGTIAAPPAIANAVADALAGAGVDPAAVTFYPLTPERLFALLQGAR